jgi:esterase/lipase superfamily enzyme
VTCRNTPSAALNRPLTRSCNGRRYGTNRKPRAEDNYSAERDDTTHFGQIQVLVPRSHEAGSTGSSAAWRWWTGVDDRLRINYFNELPAAEFWKQLRQSVAAFNADSALVFLHGYCNSFRDAAISTAQIAFDLKFQGGPARCGCARN